MPARTHKVIFRLLAVLASIALTLVALEVGLRIAGPQKYFAVPVNTWDPVTGTRQIPGAKGFVKCPEYDIHLIINSKGLRDREFPYAKPEGTRRILCLGGSFTCGYGVEAEETFAKQLEVLLNRAEVAGSTWEVLNAGMGSTGTAHQLAYYESEGYKYEPDFVLLNFSHDTDFWDNIMSGLYSVEADKLVKHDAPKTSSRRVQEIVKWIPGYTTFFARSHLLNFVKGRVSRRHYRDLAERLVLPDDQAVADDIEMDLTRRLLLALRDGCASHGARLVVTAVPPPPNTAWSDDGLEIIGYLHENGIPFIDLSGILWDGQRRGIPVAYERDRHWTPAGHRLAAEGLYGYFLNVCRGDTVDVSARR
jgi:hypothetical protein